MAYIFTLLKQIWSFFRSTKAPDTKFTEALAYFESSGTIKTTGITDEDCLLVQEVMAGTLWDRRIKMFSVLFSGLCVFWTAKSAWTTPCWCVLVGQKQPESRLSFLVKRTGTVPIISIGASSFLVPPTYTGIELTAQNNENLGKERQERKGETVHVFCL